MFYAERFPNPTRAFSPRQLPTDHVHAVPTREYQSDQSSPAPSVSSALLSKELPRANLGFFPLWNPHSSLNPALSSPAGTCSRQAARRRCGGCQNGPRRQGFAAPRNNGAPLTAPGRSQAPPMRRERP
jgi:hypothetical protein